MARIPPTARERALRQPCPRLQRDGNPPKAAVKEASLPDALTREQAITPTARASPPRARVLAPPQPPPHRRPIPPRAIARATVLPHPQLQCRPIPPRAIARATVLPHFQPQSRPIPPRARAIVLRHPRPDCRPIPLRVTARARGQSKRRWAHGHQDATPPTARVRTQRPPRLLPRLPVQHLSKPPPTAGATLTNRLRQMGQGAPCCAVRTRP
mmetsp:Transcript_101054/g.231788  ORF Transcript_101054/g.231788 Transcript_101054/m.231788 type:complete len:212 (-) Transcript_101054:1493-2128(-)